MLTAASLLSLARTRGIFAVPTRAGERGPVLLASLGLDLNDDAVQQRLLEMNGAEYSIELSRVSDAQAVWHLLQERGIDPSLLERSEVEAGNDSYHAILVDAVAVTGETVTREQIRALLAQYARDGNRRMAAHCQLALDRDGGDFEDEDQRALEIVAAAINARAGVLPAGGGSP